MTVSPAACIDRLQVAQNGKGRWRIGRLSGFVLAILLAGCTGQASRTGPSWIVGVWTFSTESAAAASAVGTGRDSGLEYDAVRFSADGSHVNGTWRLARQPQFVASRYHGPTPGFVSRYHLDDSKIYFDLDGAEEACLYERDGPDAFRTIARDGDATVIVYYVRRAVP